MAKGCIKYAIESYSHPVGWERLGAPFRETEANAIERYERIAEAWRGSMIRLVEVKVIAQYDPTGFKREKKPIDISGEMV